MGMEKVWILGGMRSFIGVKDRMYRNVPAEVLGAEVLRAVIRKYRLAEQDIDFILGGNAVGGGGNMTRLAALTAGIDREVPAVTLDLQCGSALEAVTQAAAKIESGLAELVLAGGLESSSTQPLRMWNPNHPDYEKDKVWTVARFAPGQHGEQIMLEGAERTAISEHVTKEEQDFWVLESHHRAAKAAQEGLLSDIQVSVAESCKDEGIRASMSQKLMDHLPYLLPGGCAINAANACLMHDGAAFVALCSEEYGKRHNLIPAAVLRFGTAVGGDPLMSPKTAVLAVEKLLKKTGLIYDQVDAFEVNEAFAVIDVLFDRAFPGMRERYNRFGGALAYGHPYGASGALLILHLLKSLESCRGHYGICAAAAAGGIGSAILLERR